MPKMVATMIDQTGTPRLETRVSASGRAERVRDPGGRPDVDQAGAAG